MSTPVQHAEALLSAVETLKAVEERGSAPTPAERERLRAYPGAGPVALHLFPNPQTQQYPSPAWQQRGRQLQNLLTEVEYESILRSTFSAFYTSDLVIQTAFAILARLGVPETARVLEPGCGIGHFLEAAPEDMRFVAVELDRLSARIALQLYPQHDIRQDDLTYCKLPEGTLDAAIGNVPFADVHYDYQGSRLSLHEVCLARALDAVKPGGIAVLVITHSFLDRLSPRCRELVAGKARLLGAIRLPSAAFEDQGTAVVADLVIFQTHLHPDAVTDAVPDWCQTSSLDVDGVPVPFSAYFLAHPRMLCGAVTRQGSVLQPVGYAVESREDLALAVLRAVSLLPEGVFPVSASAEEVEAEEDVSAVRPLPDGASALAEGGLYLDTDGTICQRAGRGGVQVLFSGRPLSAESGLVGQRVAALIRLREQAREVLRRQQAGAPRSARQEARALLDLQYRLFVAAHGPIGKTTVTAMKDGSVQRRQPNLARFRDDPDAMLVAALEDYDEDDGTARTTAIFRQDVVGPEAAPAVIASAEAALLASLDQTGGVDVPLISDLYGQPAETVLQELGTLVYEDPETGHWETADQYLSGNVRRKLQAAQRAGGRFTRNVAALAPVQPADLLPGEIEANLGAGWIPPADIEAFLRETCDASAWWRLTVTHVPAEAVWAVDASWHFESSVAMRTTYGTNRVDGVRLLDLALNLRLPTVRDHVGDGRTVVNLGETLAAREKLDQLREAFRQWLWKEPARAERLVRRYNDTMNTLRLRAFSGAHLRFPGMAAHLTLTAAQHDAVWRIMSGGNTLLAHAVGAGKTFIMMAAAMKLRQAGRIRKPLFVVPNHMLEQFIRECLHLYPGARMLLASSEDMSKRKRKLLSARIATSEWDGIITTHSAFERMGMSTGYQARYLRRRIADYEATLTADLPATRVEEKGRRNIRKALEKRKARYEERLDTLLAADKKDDSLTFDDLGVDYLFVDEIQEFKNLETPSKLDNVAGIQTVGSQKAFDMALKLRYLRDQQAGGFVTGASGTPISNTMVEMYTMQRYFDPDGLEDCGLGHFDAWAGTFGAITEVMEVAPDGRTMRARQRFAKFVNLTELQMRFRAFADVRTAAQLALPVPRVAGGKAQVVSCPMSAGQRRLQESLVDRYEAVRAGQVKPWEDNALAITTDGRKLALDVRLLEPTATGDPHGKIAACAEQVLALYRATRESRATQLVFCDLGVNPTAWGFSVYDALTEGLVAGGIPAAEVQCMRDATSDAEKYALQERTRQGTVAVLIGSTRKMGTGTNVQQRLVALHHLDAPWKPAEIEQREGRIIRQKNMHAEVRLFTYVTEGSFDAYMWQALQTKATFIGQVMHGAVSVREVRDVDEQALSYAEVKAIATGNPAMLVLARTEAECRRLRVLEQQHRDGQFRAQQQLKLIPEEVTKYQGRLAALRADLAVLEGTSAAEPWLLTVGPPRLDGTQAYPQEEAETLLSEWAAGVLQTRVTEDVPLGTYRGLAVLLRLHSMAEPQVLVRGHVQYEAPISRRTGVGRAIVRGVLHLLESYPLYERALVTDIEKQERTLARYGAALGAPFAQAAYKVALDALRQELQAALRETPPDGTREASAVVADIEALHAASAPEGLAVSPGPARPVDIAVPITEQIRARLSARSPEAAA